MQPTLFDIDLDQRFASFHAAHPEVYDELVRLARQLVGRGHRHLGIAMIWETARYQSMVGARPDEESWRLNNSYRSRYARMLMAQEPDLAGVFETRSLRDEAA